MNYLKVYVEVVVQFLLTGEMRPLCIIWTDGRKYDIDKVNNILRAPSNVGSLLTDKYVCVINNVCRNLFFERETQKWFLEIKAK